MFLGPPSPKFLDPLRLPCCIYIELLMERLLHKGEEQLTTFKNTSGRQEFQILA